MIGLCGYPKAGKSEVTKILIKNHGFHTPDSKRILRDITSLISGVQSESLREQGFKEMPYLGRTNREIMGEIGKTLERMFGESYLVERSLKNSREKKLVIDSLRRDQGKAFKGFVVEVVSDQHQTCMFDFDEYDRSKIVYTINNSGSKEELEKSVADMVDTLYKLS